MSWIFFLSGTLLAILIQGIFALFEMACISLNKMRLEYYVSLNNRRAIWISTLLKRSSRFFGTMLLGVTSALQIGSEFARRFYESVGLNPDFAPITQVFLVVIFAELVPMFAARRHPQQLAFFFAPLMRIFSALFWPIIWAFDGLSRLVQKIFFRSETSPALFLSREEIQKAFEEEGESQSALEAVVGNIFKIKTQTTGQVMTPITEVGRLTPHSPLSQARQLLRAQRAPFLFVVQPVSFQVLSVIYLRDLLRSSSKKTVEECARAPWFVLQDLSLLEVLDQFRRNNQSVAVILNGKGKSCGFLTLDHILNMMFGSQQDAEEAEIKKLYIERTIPGKMTIRNFNQSFDALLLAPEGQTLSDFVVSHLGHLPVKGEEFEVESFEFTVLEPTLRGVKLLSVRTLRS